MRTSEQVVLLYHAYTSVLALALPLRPDMRLRVLALNLAVYLIYAIVLWMPRRHWHGYMRDWVPLPLMLTAYKQMAWFAPSSHDFHLEMSWIRLDRLVLGEWGGRALIESLGPVIPSLLDLSYLLVYVLPVFCVAVVTGIHRRDVLDPLLTIYLLGLYLAYGQFPFWPSEPPWTVFTGDLEPSFVTPVRRSVSWLLRGQGIHTGVFPSAHASGAFAAAFALRHLLPERKRLHRGVLLYAILVAVAIVYGRYHYAVDALGGLGAAGAAYGVGLWVMRRRS